MGSGSLLGAGGEWFALNAADIAAFKKRKRFM